MATPSRIRVHHCAGEIQLTLPGGRERWHLRRLAEDTETIAYRLTVHRLKPNGWIGRREPPVVLRGVRLALELQKLSLLAGMDLHCWLRCLRIPAEAVG